MNLLNGLLGNKTLLNTALGGIRNNMQKDGISCIVLKLTDDLSGETPGLDIKSYGDRIGIISGPDLDVANRIYDLKPEALFEMIGKLGYEMDGSDECAPETWADFFKLYDECFITPAEQKEVENGI